MSAHTKIIIIIRNSYSLRLKLISGHYKKDHKNWQHKSSVEQKADKTEQKKIIIIYLIHKISNIIYRHFIIQKP